MPLTILEYPHPALRQKCRPVASIDADVVRAANDMLELMYKHEGLGLAAPQVGLDQQLLVINFVGDPEAKEHEFVAINPVITELKGNLKDREGCLSFPNLYQDIRRAKSVTVQGYTLDGKPFEMTCSDLPARIWQHEIDHLNGTLFIDKMGPIARMSSKKDLDYFQSQFERRKKKGELPGDLAAKI
jgi:peptide deformylase